ncbi:hypothetical protein [Moheibacter lacus]|uniref:Por secretion system C-terminal sorting domain-containing protein n=1 Tax=Moheibacter lacus TaxID=2745851 RepID=A0A838ZRH8_9FLAO|nr:hypothetical protein [Moheibacter lacus]MBA5628943.1 hypothetical protein [Moheibacter lacus]
MRNPLYLFSRVFSVLFLFVVLIDSNAQTTIYEEDFEELVPGAIVYEHQDSWQQSGSTYGFLDYTHQFGIHPGGQAISGQSLGISLYSDENLEVYFGFQYTSCEFPTPFDLATYKAISTSGHENIQLQFDWKGMGENLNGNWVDYGQIGYSTTGGPPFIWLTEGGFSGDGFYHDQANAQNIIVSFPEEAANQPNFTLAFRSKANNCGGAAPQFILDNLVLSGTTDVQNRSLIVSGAYEGATYADGTYSIQNNTNITLTSGNRVGYEITGWTGTGSVPSTGTSGTLTIDILEDSEIHWVWEESQPQNIAFLDVDGSQILTFNNSRYNWETPVFRLIHQGDTADEYEIEINTSADFTGTSWMQNYTGSFPGNEAVSFIFDNGFNPVNNTTYYVRARAKGISHGIWSDWNAALQSFTHQLGGEMADWFQTTQAQFQSDENEFTEITSSGEVRVMDAESNDFLNGSFENALTNWNTQSNQSSNYIADISEKWAVDGNYSVEFYNRNPFVNGYFEGDYIQINQIVDLTGVSQLLMTAKYEGSSVMNVELRVYISEVYGPEEEFGTLVYQWTPDSNFATEDLEIDLTSFMLSGEKRIQLMYYVNDQQTGVAQHKILNLDHVRTTTATEGELRSTAINLASIPEATAYQSLSWNQTLGTGNLTLKIQERTGEIWSDVPGFDSISMAGDGLHTISLAEMPAFDQIRLVGILSGEEVALQDWSVQFRDGDCPSETIWDGAAWSNGIPIDPTVKIIIEADFTTDESNTLNHELVGCSLEALAGVEVIIDSGYSLILDNELNVDDENGASFIIENDANLLQINPVQNTGKITLKRQATVPSNQYNYWASPVVGQNLYALYSGIPNNRVMTYNTWNDYFSIVPAGTLSSFGKGYSIKGSASNYPQGSDDPEDIWVTALFVGVPQNSSEYEEENRIPLDTLGNKYNLIGNPFPSNLNLKELYLANEDQFYNDETEETPAFYFWDNTGNMELTQQGSGYSGNNYAIYNPLSGGVAATGGDKMKKPNGIVKPGQGFIIKAAENATSLLLDNDMRTTATRLTEDGDEAVYYKNPENNGSRKQNSKFWIELVNPNGVHVQMAIGYFKEADNGFEKYDSPIFNESVSENIYSISKDDKKLAIQGRQGPFRKSDVVPLGVKIANPGKYKIQLEDRLGIFNTHQTIYLRDKLTQTVHNLSESAFEWGAEPGEFTDRFEIVYKKGNIAKESLLTGNNDLKIQKINKQIVISSEKEKLAEVEILNLSGWSLYQNNSVNAKELILPAEQFGKGIIVIKVQTETGEIVSRKMINK